MPQPNLPVAKINFEENQSTSLQAWPIPGTHDVGFGFRVSGFGFRVSGFGFRVSSFGFRVSGFGSRVDRYPILLDTLEDGLEVVGVPAASIQGMSYLLTTHWS